MTDLRNSTSMTSLFGGMTGNERRLGRFIRDGEGHPAPAPAAEPAAEEPTGNEMPDLEPPAAEGPKEVTAEDLEKEFGGDPAPAAPAEEPAKDEAPTAKPDEAAKPVEKTPAVLEAEARASEAQRQADYWRDQAAKVAPPKEAAAEVDPNAEPKAEDYEFGEADIKYIQDVARHSARAEFQAQATQAAQQAEFSRLDANYQSNIAKATERLPDFDAKVTQTALKGEWPCPPLIAMGIRDSEVGPDIAYHLANDVTEAKRIAALDPYMQAREFGRLEGRFLNEASSRTEAAKAPPAAKVTQAPTPPNSLSRGAGGKFTVNADTNDFAAFEASADKILAS